MNRVLITLIGAGQKELNKVFDGVYQLTEYFFQQQPENYVQTLFTSEAVVRLAEPPFDEVHIFGTQQAMWDTLYRYCRVNTRKKTKHQLLSVQERKMIQHLFEKRTGPYELTEDELLPVCRAFEKFTGVADCRAHLLPLGQQENELWKILQTMIDSVNLQNCRVCLDITYSLRYHPLFLLLVLKYYQTAMNVQVESIYYGGFELKDRPGNQNRSPILDLKLFFDLFSWIDAAHVFQKFGEPGPIAELLQQEQDSLSLAAALDEFSFALQFNAFANVPNKARSLLQYLNETESQNHLFQILSPVLQQFPQIASQHRYDWQAYLHLAEHYYAHDRLNQAIPAAWESIIARLRQVYKISLQQMNKPLFHRQGRPIYPYFCLSKITQHRIFESKTKALDRNLYFYINKLREYRNQTAHGGSVRKKQIQCDFDIIFNQLKTHLQHQLWEEMPKSIPLERLY